MTVLLEWSADMELTQSLLLEGLLNKKYGEQHSLSLTIRDSITHLQRPFLLIYGKF